MAQSQKNIVTTVEELLKPVIEGLGYELWDVEFCREGARFYLRITIDSENGIGIDDCETVHRAIDPVLDEADPIEPSYYLEVSSPGIERTLRTKTHFAKTVGEQIACRLFVAINGTKSVTGVLSEASDDGVVLTLPDETQLSLTYKQIAKANVVFEF
jgi:ribosome maturation factor RimP